MQLTFDENFATNYKSASQKARVLTEQWVDSSVYCPNCGHLEIDKYPNNRPVADFFFAQIVKKIMNSKVNKILLVRKCKTAFTWSRLSLVSKSAR